MASCIRYEYRRKPIKCPQCQSVRVAKIFYGMPAFSLELKHDLDAGRIFLGGCCISGDDPWWRCVDCGTELYRKPK